MTRAVIDVNQVPEEEALSHLITLPDEGVPLDEDTQGNGTSSADGSSGISMPSFQVMSTFPRRCCAVCAPGNDDGDTQQPPAPLPLSNLLKHNDLGLFARKLKRHPTLR